MTEKTFGMGESVSGTSDELRDLADSVRSHERRHDLDNVMSDAVTVLRISVAMHGGEL